MSSFVHLHVHSYYSILDGMSSISGLVDKAIANGMPAIALTDHGNMFGIKQFFNYVKKKNEGSKTPFKPILGVEAYVARRNLHSKEKNDKIDRGGHHLILLAKNKTGYKNLCKLVSVSWLEGHYYKPRIDKEILEQYSEGLIVSSACLGGEIPQKLLGGAARDVDDEDVKNNGYDDGIIISNESIWDAEKSIEWFKRVFGDDFYLEIQRHKTDKLNADTKVFKYQTAVNKAVLELAERTNTKVIATNDVHFVEEEHGEAHDRLICLSTGKDLGDPKRMRYTKQEWLKTPTEMLQIFADVPQTLENTLEIAGKVEFYDINSDALMPVFDIPKTFGTEEEYRQKFTENDLKTEFGDAYERLGGYDKVLRVQFEADYLSKLVYEGAKSRYGETLTDEQQERIDFELNTMKTMGFPGYFLIVQDFIEAARGMGVSVGPGRGSAAGSVIAYCLRIINIDPLKYDLLFERFLNPDRISMPDIDIDFDDDGRGKVLQWVTEKYGKERVAHIITCGTMAAKSAIKDVARVQKLPLSESDRLSKLVPDKFPEGADGNAPEVNLTNCYKLVPEFRSELNSFDENIKTTLKYAQMLEGTVRQTGVHACGVIIGSDDLTNFVPVSTVIDKETKEEVMVTQYEGSVIEEIGLIKVDFLGLKTLSIIKECIVNIKKTKGIDLDINTIDFTDKKTYELFARGETTGTFQFESDGMKKYLRELQPTQFEDLIAMNALYRPGPMQYIPSFINRKHGKEKIIYDIDIMEKRLKDTYGITVYQEQVMLLSRDLAGFTRGQSDELRKAMGKKMKDKMVALKEKFLAGGTANGHNEKVLEKIWNDWAEFAKYAFNKSHATCYSWVAYQTAYLKAHFPAEFMAANLTCNKDNIKEVEKFMDECKAMGINVLSPDVNESDLNFNVTKDGNIRFGLGGIKGVGEGAVAAIVAEREQNGKFQSIFDFLERVNLNACNKKTLESLAFAGGFDYFNSTKREQFFALNEKGEFTFDDNLLQYGNKFQESKDKMQNSLFGGFDEVAITRPTLQKQENWSPLAKLNKEREYIGMYLSSHPLEEYEFELQYVCNANTLEIKALEEKIKSPSLNGAELKKMRGKVLRFGGIVTGFRSGTTKKGNPYGIIAIEDYVGACEVPLWQQNFVDYQKYGVKDLYIYVQATVQERGSDWGKPQEENWELKITSVDLLERTKNQIKRLTLSIPFQQITDDFVVAFSDMVMAEKGDVNVYMQILDEFSPVKFTLFSRQHRTRIDKRMYRFLKKSKAEGLIDFQVS